MLTRASFQNYKALKAVDVDLSPFTVIVGKNGSGKTSVLQGIHDASQVAVRQANEEWAQQRLGLVFADARSPARLITRPDGGTMKIVLTDTDGDSLSVEAKLARSNNGRSERAEFVVAAPGSGLSPLALPKATQQAADEAEQFFGSPKVQKFGSSAFLRLDARVLMRGSVIESERPQLRPDGDGLASVLNYMAGAEPEALDVIRRDLTAVVPQVRRILTLPAMIARPGGSAMGHRIELDMGEGRRVPADMLSEGTLLALGLITALRLPSCPRLVLMDDVDTGLHTTAQAELVRCLRRIQGEHAGVQIICTSHSPYLLDHVALDEVRVMALDVNGYAGCRRLVDHPESAEWRDMLRTGEFWASVGEDWVVEAASAP